MQVGAGKLQRRTQARPAGANDQAVETSLLDACTHGTATTTSAQITIPLNTSPSIMISRKRIRQLCT